MITADEDFLAKDMPGLIRLENQAFWGGGKIRRLNKIAERNLSKHRGLQVAKIGCLLGCLNNLGVFCRLGCEHRQGKEEGRTFARLAFGPHFATVILDDVFYDGEAQAGTALLPGTRLVHTIKALEDAIQ